VAVSQLDQMTQQNAALVEQSAAAAESLKDQAVKLARAVSVFKFST
jgi:methyl-accepting chemotaxis protein